MGDSIVVLQCIRKVRRESPSGSGLMFSETRITFTLTMSQPTP